MKARHIHKSEVVDGREVEYVAAILMTREELDLVYNHLFGAMCDTDDEETDVDAIVVGLSALIQEIDASARDITAQGTLSEEGKKRYSHLKPVHPGVAGRGDDCGR